MAEDKDKPNNLSLSLDDTLQKPKEISLEVADDAGGAMRDAVEKPKSEMDVPTPDKWLPTSKATITHSATPVGGDTREVVRPPDQRSTKPDSEEGWAVLEKKVMD